MIPLEQRVLANIRRRKMLNPGDRVGVAVSGGADSVGLLRLVETLRGRLGISLLVVHFDHRLRGTESDADAEFVVELARDLGIECVVERGDVLGAASKNKWNLEDAGRRMRSAFFERLVAEEKASRIAVAHTEDDQAETVLAHLLRGTGPTGLAGIHPETGAIVRPLLVARYWPQDMPDDPEKNFMAQVHDDLRTATVNSREWAEEGPQPASEGRPRRFRRGRGLYWRPRDPVVRG